jgi:hypothetical protein
MAKKKIPPKIYITLLAFFFLSAILTIAFHYERYIFLLAGCSICNIKNSTSLSVQKVKTDPLSAMVSGCPWAGEILAASKEISLIDGPAFIPSLLSCTLFNKAPPIIS